MLKKDRSINLQRIHTPELREASAASQCTSRASDDVADLQGLGAF
jgi:hypothetical protein